MDQPTRPLTSDREEFLRESDEALSRSEVEQRLPPACLRCGSPMMTAQIGAARLTAVYPLELRVRTEKRSRQWQMEARIECLAFVCKECGYVELRVEDIQPLQE